MRDLATGAELSRTVLADPITGVDITVSPTGEFSYNTLAEDITCEFLLQLPFRVTAEGTTASGEPILAPFVSRVSESCALAAVRTAR